MEKKKITISIIIPCFNQGNYLPEAIDSALAQTIRTHEIITVIDGSTDNSLEIARNYENKGVKIINQVNKGLSSARNTGIMNATGDYILPLDADDVLLENCAEKILKVAEKTGADVIAPSFKTFGTTSQEVILSPQIHLKDFIGANRLGYFSAIKKSVLLEVGGYNPKMIYGYEDWDCWIDIFKRNKTLAVIPEVLVLYRTKESSMLVEADKHRDELIAQMRKNHPDVYNEQNTYNRK